MGKWDQIVTEQSIKKAVASLAKNGIEAFVVENGVDAKKKVLEIIPKGAEVMTMSSVTLETIGVTHEINESGDYAAVKPKLMAMDRETQGLDMQKLSAAPEWAVGSVHAVTEDGKVLIASNTGSQLAGYVYGSMHVIWVVGAQKIVKNLEEGMKRVYDYVLPLESQRLKKAYGVQSNVSKFLVVNKEVNPDRIKMIIVKEPLGF